MSPDLAILASPPALRNEGSGLLPLTAKAASFSGIGYARRNGETLCMGQFQGGFALCTVMSGEFLDGSLNRIDPFRLTEPKLVYLRVTTEASSGPTMSVDVRSERADTTIVTPKVRIDLPRCGVSGIYQAPLLLIPEACPAGPSSGGPSPLASLAVPLGEGRLWATAPAGNALASADSAFPAALRLRFLTRDGSQLTPPDIPAAPEMTGMTQQTVIGDSSDSYAESVWVEIRAENPYDWTQLQDTDAAVGIAESPNTAYLEPTDRFYDGELGSTLLDHTGKIGGDEGGAFLPLQHGSRRQRLSSVANLRWNRVTNTADSVLPYAGSRGARIHPKPAIGMTAADPIEGPILETSQWVDEGTYGRSRGDAPAPPGAESYWTRSQNQVRDWLEKKAWDVWADTPDDASGQVNEMCRIPRLVMEDVFQTQFGLVNSNWPTVVRFNPVSSVRLRRPRPDSSPWELFYYGFYEVAPADGFPSVAIHEARHSFQFTWKARGAVDTDDDFLFAPNSCVTAASAELFDRPNTDDPASSGSGNGDGHFRGDGPGLKDEVASVKSMLEHEAMRFVNRTGNSLGLNCALSAFSLITSPEMTGSAGTALPGGIRVEVSAKESRQGALIDVPRSGVTVRFTVPEGSTALVNGLKRAWVMTNETGQASVDITNGAAGSTTEIAVNLLPPMAPQNECSLFPFATILNVILHAQ